MGLRGVWYAWRAGGGDGSSVPERERRGLGVRCGARASPRGQAEARGACWARPSRWIAARRTRWTAQVLSGRSSAVLYAAACVDSAPSMRRSSPSGRSSALPHSMSSARSATSSASRVPCAAGVAGRRASTQTAWGRASRAR
eukprot:4347885-Prymnesium_polylepis.1